MRIQLLILLTVTAAACASGVARGHLVEPAYDDFSGRLIQLSADQDGDGRIDQLTYLDGNRVLRGEADTDGDGRIDRWEYFDGNGTLMSIGESSRNDGIEDTWTDPSATPTGERHVMRATARDRFRNRSEYFIGAALVRVEEDTNVDGRTDKWERYQNGVLREADFDTTFNTGRPDRRVSYDAQGRFTAVEAIPAR